MRTIFHGNRFFVGVLAALVLVAAAPLGAETHAPIVLHAARLLQVDTGKVLTPGEVLVVGERIAAVGVTVEHPQGAQVIDLGNVTLMPGLIDTHIHLFLHPGAEDLQTVEESVPWRTLIAADAAKADLLAGFTAERDMGTEGAGSADTAVRNAINSGLIAGPRLQVSGNAIDIVGGHEDAVKYNPAQHVLPNADLANNATELVAVMREQRKQGSDFFKIYATGKDKVVNGHIVSPYQYTEAELAAAVIEARRMGTIVSVHAQDDPGALYAARAGVASIDHASELSEETMRLMIEKHIPSIPTFAIFEYFADHASSPQMAERERAMIAIKAAEFKKQIARGVPFAVGSDVGPFPHGTQAHEMTLMVRYGMTPLAALQADLLEGARVMGWSDRIGQLKPGYYADVVAVPGNPLDDISVVEHVSFVMKGGQVVRR
jgi:imidazolonepropionase-like amidohydrolase